MNALPKLVFSRTLDHVDWNNTRLAQTDPFAELAKLKQRPGKDIAIFGSSDLVLNFIENGLIDEVRIFVAPVFVSAGKPLLNGIKERLHLKPVETKVFKSGVIWLFYATKQQLPSNLVAGGHSSPHLPSKSRA